ncbi:MAG: SDR family oxidoreductase [Acidimicrobiales bacterium]|jgi:NAD(P)-dependent dehydrogenase (short-subunit alcohol dehydrogenase family)|nr:SDR family oxidoreductase [Acidimicrobiales bacterium]
MERTSRSAGRLVGKVAIVTGAGGAGVGGLGVTYVRALAAEGASVVVSDLDGEAAANVAASLVADGGSAIGVRCDVTSDEDIDATVRAAVDAFGGVDILVNNAGLARGKWNESTTLAREDWRLIMDVNTIAAVRFAAAVQPVMAARGGGVIVNQSSDASVMEAGAYTVSKAAIDAVTRVLAAELSEDGIRVNGIAPGVMTAKMPPEQVASLLARQTVRRAGRPEDLVGALLYLCSDDSSFVNGQTITVDGGMARIPNQ